MYNEYCKFPFYKFICLPLLAILFCYTKAIYAVNHHYIDIHGNSLDKHDYIWEQLNPLFENKCPQIIKVDYGSSTSNIDVRNNIVKISMRSYHRQFANTLAHETSHLCLMHYSEGINNLNEFRFLDEGYVMIIAEKISNTFDDYKQFAIDVAIRENKKNKLSFELIQNWREYFSKVSNGCVRPLYYNWNAYPVASSFIFFLEDTYGNDVTKRIFRSIANTKSLKKSFKEVLNKSIEQIENEWKGYILKHKKINKTICNKKYLPRITEIFPKNNSTNVPTDLNEIFVKFNVPMKNKIYFGTNYIQAIEYKNAYWKDENTLAIKIKEKLLKGYTYHLTLGTNVDGSLISKAGEHFPLTDWSFTTQEM